MAKPDPEFGAVARGEQELLRLTFCGIIIASFFGALAAGHDLQHLISPSGSAAGTVVLGLSAGLGFAYLVSVASALKYQRPRTVDRFPLSQAISHFFYDTSIDIFGIYILLLLVEWVDGHLLHLPHTPWLLPVYLVLFAVTYVVARVVWALAQQVIEWRYEQNNKGHELLDKLRRR